MKVLSLLGLLLLAGGLWLTGAFGGAGGSYSTFSDTETDSATFQAGPFPDIPATVELKPEKVKVQFKAGEPKAKKEKALIQLAGRDVNDIVSSSVELCTPGPGGGCISAFRGKVKKDEVTFQAEFDGRQVGELLAGLVGQEVTLSVTGIVAGRTFSGADTVKVK